MVEKREDDESGSIPPRSGRFYHANGQWWVSTREGKPIGPFDTREEAEQALTDFLDFIQTANPELLVNFFKAFLNEGSPEQS